MIQAHRVELYHSHFLTIDENNRVRLFHYEPLNFRLLPFCEDGDKCTRCDDIVHWYSSRHPFGVWYNVHLYFIKQLSSVKLFDNGLCVYIYADELDYHGLSEFEDSDVEDSDSICSCDSEISLLEEFEKVL